MIPKVVNLHNLPSDYDRSNMVYCGRGSIWGNPFKIGPDGDRDEVIAKFERSALPLLKKTGQLKTLKGKDLACYCAPLRCHCDILLMEANRE